MAKQKYANVIVNVEFIMPVSDVDLSATGKSVSLNLTEHELIETIRSGRWIHVSNAQVCYIREE